MPVINPYMLYAKAKTVRWKEGGVGGLDLIRIESCVINVQTKINLYKNVKYKLKNFIMSMMRKHMQRKDIGVRG